MKIAVTGATGFVGKQVAETFRRKGMTIYSASRAFHTGQLGDMHQVRSPELLPESDWSTVVKDMDVVVHRAARVTGKGVVAQRLLGSLEANISRTKEVLEWEPPFGVCEGVKQTVADYKQQRKSRL